MIANESVDYLLRMKKRGVACKLDLEKAYDHVNWSCLLSILRQMNFGYTWIDGSIFSRMLMKAEKLGWIKGMHFGRFGDNRVTVSHILYADDTLLFCEAEKEQILYLKGVLQVFEVVTGLRTNLAKSSIFSINADNTVEELATILGCKVEKFPTIYLGLPLGARKNDQNMWQGVLDRCANKLVPWKKQYLSMGG
ncbi:uncharacterized protein LOC142165955 [Nicotiana tabacum]|uniref:Uncharacterized protein LOC142165955 n=1 Tax=Nicotiana tabacum TaxID=4097 RepID=A0AC58S636_TOBAC